MSTKKQIRFPVFKRKPGQKPFYTSLYFWLKAALLTGLFFLWLPILTPQSIISTADYGSVKQKVFNVLDETLYPIQDTQKMRRYLGINPDEYEKIEFYRSDDAMNAQEMLLVQFEQGQDLSDLKSSIEERIASQSNTYEGYAPEQKALVDQAITDFQGNYALYYIGDEGQKVDEIFQSALKESS